MTNERFHVCGLLPRVTLLATLAFVAACSSGSSGSPNQGTSGSPEGGGEDDATTQTDASAAGQDASVSDAHSDAPHESGEGGSDGGDAGHASHDGGGSDGAATASDASSDGETSSFDATVSDAGGAAEASVNEASAESGATGDGGDAPAGQAGVNAYCSAVCGREATCLSAAPDASCTCNTGSLSLYRSDYVAELAACESTATCQEILQPDAGPADAGIEACAEGVLATLTPTAAVSTFCADVGNSTCSQDIISDCPDNIKVYSDVTVNALITCISDPTCTDHTDCYTTALTP
jgi:hypothetical protein